MADTSMQVEQRNGLRPGDFFQNFLGSSPIWYKRTIITFLIINPVLWLLYASADEGSILAMLGPITGWLLVLQFIFTLAMALKCYPLQPGGLLAFEAIVLGMAKPETVYYEIQQNLPVILLLMFMVAGVFFMKDLLLFVFTKLLLKVRSKLAISLLFLLVAAILSAFLDALTVIAVVITVGVGFHKVVMDACSDDSEITQYSERIDFAVDVLQFRKFLRNIMMHAAIGTALGGVCTIVGEPQNLLIAKKMHWEFVEFFVRMSIVTMPVLVVGIISCILLEKTRWFSYGATMPQSILAQLQRFDEEKRKSMTGGDVARYVIQAVAAIFLVFALAFHVAEVGLIGLSIIVLQTAWNGVIREHDIGPAFEEALPFTALLVVFFAIVAVIHELHLFTPISQAIFTLDESLQPSIFYIANGLLSVISDNVFVATVYITEVVGSSPEQPGVLDCGLPVGVGKDAVVVGEGLDAALCEKLAVAINTGTNIPSVGTPNGQAAFLFLLTSSLAPKIGLTYMRMVFMALPYTLVLGFTGWAMVHFFLA